MPSLVTRHPATPPAARRHVRRACAIALMSLAPGVLDAQVHPSHTDDAAPVPAGAIRIRLSTTWTRYDERFAAGGRRTLGEEISTDALGVQQFPLLQPVQAGLQALTNDPAFRLSLGRLNVQSDARLVTTPIALEYGLTRRLSVGLLVPIVQTRRAVHVRVNDDSARSRGNVGFVPVRLREEAATANNAVFMAYSRAADSLATLLARCPASPLANGCAAVLANTADAQASGLQARAYASAVRVLGIEKTEALIAPRDTALTRRIDARRVALNAKLATYLGAGAGANTGVFTAQSNFSYIDLQGRNGATGFLQSTLGGGLDSIQTINRLVLGGVTIGAQYLLMDRFHADTSPATGLQSRLMVGAAVRLETAFMDSVRKRGTIRTGDGPGVELRSAMDIIAGSLGGTIAARYLHAFAQTVELPLLGDPDAFFPVPQFGSATRTAGSVIGIDVTPRYRLGEWFAINGHYGLERVGAPTYSREVTCAGTCDTSFAPVSLTSHQVGIGIRYSTVDAFLRGAVRTPIEVSFTHLETIAGSEGAPRLRRDQIQLRIFLRLRRRI